jgi:DNA-binding CsgD family transcriptional regulator
MELIDLSSVSPGDEVRQDFLNQLCQNCELDFASYAAMGPATGAVRGYATYPEEWKRLYAELGFHMVDPTLHASLRSIAPVDWGRFNSHSGFHDVFGTAKDFCITARGLTVPVRGPHGDCGLLSVTRDCPEGEWLSLKRKIIGTLQMAAVHMHDAVMDDSALYKVLRAPQLSSREREILQWVATGKSQQDVADILYISYRTVEVHLRSARDKLGALTTAHAVGRAIRLGYVVPD